MGGGDPSYNLTREQIILTNKDGVSLSFSISSDTIGNLEVGIAEKYHQDEMLFRNKNTQNIRRDTNVDAAVAVADAATVAFSTAVGLAMTPVVVDLRATRGAAAAKAANREPRRANRKADRVILKKT